MVIDVLLLLVLAGGLGLGFFRGLLRQLLAVGAWFVCFVLAVHLRAPLGDWLAGQAGQSTLTYMYMLSFALLYLVLVGIGLLVTEFGGAPSALTRHALLDDAAGGVLGLLLAALFIAGATVALDSYHLRAPDPVSGEIGWLRDLHGGLQESSIGTVVRDWLIRPLGSLLGPLLPTDVRSVMV